MKITRKQLRQIINEELNRLNESAAPSWPVFRTHGGGGMDFISAVGKVFRRGSEATNLLENIPGSEDKHNTIYYDIADGKITTTIEPEDPKVLEVAEEIAKIIEDSGQMQGRHPGKVMLSTDPQKSQVQWP